MAVEHVKGIRAAVYSAEDRLYQRSELMRDIGSTVEFEEFGSFWSIEPTTRFYDLNQVKGFVEEVHRFILKTHNADATVPNIRMTPQVNYSYYRAGNVYLRKVNGMFDSMEVLHEVSHHYYSSGHGKKFIEGYLELISEYMGPSASMYFNILVHEEADLKGAKIK